MSADSRPHHRLRGYEGQFRVDPPGNGGKVWYRRFSRVRVFAGEGLLAEPIAGPQLQWRELVFMPPQHPLAPMTVGGSPAQPRSLPLSAQDLRRAATSFDGTAGTHFITADRWPVLLTVDTPPISCTASHRSGATA